MLNSVSIATLRQRFLGRALHYGLPDFDASAIMMAEPRRFIQEISRFL